MSTTPSLFPAPAIPAEAQADVQLAATAAMLTHRKLGEALLRGQWSEQAAAEIGALIAASKSIHERATALLVPPGGKR